MAVAVAVAVVAVAVVAAAVVDLWGEAQQPALQQWHQPATTPTTKRQHHQQGCCWRLD